MFGTEYFKSKEQLTSAKMNTISDAIDKVEQQATDIVGNASEEYNSLEKIEAIIKETWKTIE